MTSEKNNPHRKDVAERNRGRGRPRKPAEPELPTYDSMRACANATGIPYPVIRSAKSGGCEAFRNTRVELGPLLRWIFSQEAASDDNIDWSVELRKFQAQREEIRLAKDRQEVMDRSEVIEGAGAVMGELFGNLDRVFLSELPPVLKGLDEKAIRAEGVKAIEELKERLKDVFRSFEK